MASNYDDDGLGEPSADDEEALSPKGSRGLGLFQNLEDFLDEARTLSIRCDTVVNDLVGRFKSSE